MTSLTRGQTFEVVFWIGFAALAYYFSFEFDQEIEIYLFGASGWPRVVIALIVLAALCQLIQDLVGRSSAQLVQRIGNVALLYRPAEKPTIVLPS